MEYCGVGSVSDIMRLRGAEMSEPQVATIFAGTLRGLNYLHSKKTIHRDVKAGNVLIEENGPAVRGGAEAEHGDWYAVLDGTRGDPGGGV